MARERDGVRERLKTLQMGQKLDDFSKRCGVLAPTLRKYLTGERIPESEQLAIISDNLNISIDWLLSGKMAKVSDMTDAQIIQICKLDPEVIEVDCSSGKAIPVVKTYDDEKYHLQFYCIHCKCWHYHGRGGKEYPYTEGRGGMAGDRTAHCFTMNSPFLKNGIILDVVGKLKDLKPKPRSKVSHICERCHNYYSAAFNACICGWKGKKRDIAYQKLAELYQQISIYPHGNYPSITKEKLSEPPQNDSSELVQRRRDEPPDLDREKFEQDLDGLFSIIRRWQEEENGADPFTSMQFIQLFHERIPELGEWIKKQKGNAAHGAIQKKLSVNNRE